MTYYQSLARASRILGASAPPSKAARQKPLSASQKARAAEMAAARTEVRAMLAADAERQQRQAAAAAIWDRIRGRSAGGAA